MNNLYLLIKSELPRIFTSKQFKQLLDTHSAHPKHSLHLLNELVNRGKIIRFGGGIYKIA